MPTAACGAAEAKRAVERYGVGAEVRLPKVFAVPPEE